MEKNQKGLKQKNAYLFTYEAEYKGKKYINYKVLVELTNGYVVDFDISQRLFNRKFDYFVKCNLPRK